MKKNENDDLTACVHKFAFCASAGDAAPYNPRSVANVKGAFETTFSCNKFSLLLEKSIKKF